MSKQDKILTYMYTCVMTTFYNTTIKSLDCSLVRDLSEITRGEGGVQKGQGSSFFQPFKRVGH